MSTHRASHCFRETRRERARRFARGAPPARDVDAAERRILDLEQRTDSLVSVVLGLLDRIGRLEKAPR